MLAEYLAELAAVQLLTPDEEQRLWQAYRERHDDDARERLIACYQPLVFKEATRLQQREPVLLDLVQEGSVGLIEAAERYDYARGVAFSLYARHRIRGRMLDYLARSGMEVAVPAAIWEDTLEAADPTAQPADAFECADRGILWEQVREALMRLPEKERLVVESIYIGEREPKEVADALAVSRTYIYQLQKKGIRRLRGMLSRLMQERKQ